MDHNKQCDQYQNYIQVFYDRPTLQLTIFKILWFFENRESIDAWCVPNRKID